MKILANQRLRSTVTANSENKELRVRLEKDIDEIRRDLFDNSKTLSRMASDLNIDPSLRKKFREAEDSLDSVRKVLFKISAYELR